jgi:hypothetical protein
MSASIRIFVAIILMASRRARSAGSMHADRLPLSSSHPTSDYSNL